MSNTLKKLTDIGKTNINYFIFFRNFFNKSNLKSRLGKAEFLNFSYEKNNLSF